MLRLENGLWVNTLVLSGVRFECRICFEHKNRSQSSRPPATPLRRVSVKTYRGPRKWESTALLVWFSYPMKWRSWSVAHGELFNSSETSIFLILPCCRVIVHRGTAGCGCSTTRTTWSLRLPTWPIFRAWYSWTCTTISSTRSKAPCPQWARCEWWWWERTRSKRYR